MNFSSSAIRPFSPERFQQQLNTRRLGQTIHYFPSIDSTNDYAKTLSGPTTADGDIIIADYQTAGRGRRSRYWFSSYAQGLTFSLILSNNLSGKTVSLFPLVGGIGVARLLTDLRFQGVGLKWPNDVFLDDKKVAGILCESRFQGRKLCQLIIGIGINVNEMKNDIPLDLLHTATSLAIVAGHPLERETILASLLRHLEQLFNTLERRNSTAIVEEWMTFCRHKNQPVQVQDRNQYYRGIFIGLTSDGKARVIIDGREKIITTEAVI
ncbi:MAG: biotin--[acetyl-CoA-carboxylase] ligase [Fidelibacterota bacterium]